MNQANQDAARQTLADEIQKLDTVAWELHHKLFSPQVTDTPREPKNIPTGEIQLAMYIIQEITGRLKEVDYELGSLK